MKKTFLASALSLSIFISLGIGTVYALPEPSNQTTNDSGSQTTNDKNVTTKIFIDNPFKNSETSIVKLFKTILEDVLIPIGGIICVFAFILAGFKYVTAQGDEGQIKSAHKTLLYAAIGTAILLGSWVLAKAICGTIAQLGGPKCPA